MKPFYVYLLRCADGSYYCGQTDDIDVRMQQHYAGDIGYTSTRKPVELVWQGEFESRVGALAFEQQIKGWSRAKKEALIAGDWRRIQQLAKSPTPVRAVPHPARPEPVEGHNPNTVRPEPVEGHTPSVRPELVEGHNPNTVRPELGLS